MFGTVLKGLWGGTKAVAAGKTQANLGLQSPHLPAAIVRVSRFVFSTSAIWITGSWYSGYVNQRTDPGSGPKLVLPGMPVKNASASRPEKTPKYAQGTTTPNEVPGGSQANAKTLPGSGSAGGFLPRNAPYTAGRQDQGRDGKTTPGGPLIAPGPGRVVRVASDPNGFGPDYPIVKFTGGPYAGRIIYLGHTHSALRSGTAFRKDSILSFTGKTPVGNATVPGWFEVGYADSGSPGAFGQPAPF